MADKVSEFNHKTQPIYWLETSVSLKYSADLLLKEARERGENIIRLSFNDPWMGFTSELKVNRMVLQSYMVLMGLALENFMKAIAIFQNPDLVNFEDSKLQKVILKHDLCELAVMIDLDFETLPFDAAAFLKKASIFVIWAGWYPVATNGTQHQDVPLDKENYPSWCNSLWEMLMQTLNQILHGKGGIFPIMPRQNWPR